jgi:anaerobic selenocysteine-containing dehydrogenase
LTGLGGPATIVLEMTAAREFLRSSPGPASAPGSERARLSAPIHPALAPESGLSPAAGNRALARAMADAAASRTMGFAQAAATRTLARCPGCGGRCGGTCGKSAAEPDEELLASGQHALRRAVLARQSRTLSLGS